MMKSTLFFIPLMIVAVSAFAAQDKVEMASVDKDVHLRVIKPSVPPVVTEKYEYYEVKGGSETELRCDMNNNSCKWEDGKKYDSVTSWRVKWDYGYDRGSQACSAVSFKASVEVVFRYPQWVNAGGGDGGVSQPLVAKWDRYMKNLAIHENGHRDMAVKAAAELSHAVAELPPAQSCADLDREVRALCRLRMKKLNEDEKAYDVSTKHGLTQGAIFP
jgi:predicted secreted Zn-dependent protease